MYSRLLLLDSYISRHEKSLVVLLLAVFFARAFAISRITPMVPDELLTYVQVQLPNAGAVLAALKHLPTVIDPPLPTLLSFLALRLPLPAPLALRIPSFIAYAAMMLSLFVLARRWAPPSLALVAFVLPMILPVFDFAVQCRPYALVLASAGWALVFWVRAAERRSHRLPLLILLFLSVACAVSAQYLAPLLLAPLVAAELWRAVRSRSDIPVWIALISAALALIVYVPFLPAAAPYRINVWHGVVLEDLRETYMLAVSPIVVVLLAACIFLYFATSASKPEATGERDGPPCRDYECVAVATLYLIPVITFGAAKLATHSYLPRYAIMFSIAAVLLVTALFAILTRGRRAFAVLLLICVLLPSAHPLVSLAGAPPSDPNAMNAVSIENLNRFSDLPIAVPDWFVYLRIYFFGPHRFRSRMVLVSSSLTAEAVAHDLKVSRPTYAEFVGAHSQFLLVDKAEGMREKLLRDGSRLLWIGMVEGEDAYLVQAAASPS